MMLQGVWVDALCISSTHKCIIGEKGGRKREQSGESVFGHTMWLHIAVAANHVFPPQRYAHMTGVYEQGRLVRLPRKNTFKLFPVSMFILRAFESSVWVLFHNSRYIASWRSQRSQTLGNAWKWLLGAPESVRIRKNLV